jgi:hypothetical protein
MGRSDSLPSIPPRFVAFAWRYRSALTCSLPSSAERCRRRPGVFITRLPLDPGLTRRRQGLPGSWGTHCVHALLSDPGGTSAPGHLGASVLPSAILTTSAPTTRIFRGSITRPTHSLSTLRHNGHPWPRKTCFRLLASFTGRDWLPAGLLCRVSELLTSHPPCPGFFLAHKKQVPGVVI